MYTKWTQHLTDQADKDDFQKYIINSRPVLDRLKTLLEEKEKALDRSEIDPRSFDSPNWAHKQAYKNGVRACINDLKTLVDLDQQRGTTHDRELTGRQY